MSVILFNPTNEDLETQYSGVVTRIPKRGEDGHMLKVDDAKGRHILNVLGPRGLTQLEYGDDSDGGIKKEQKAADGVRRNLEFKKKQVMTYNRDNEARKNKHLEYLQIPKQVEDYAKELGIGLIEAYNIPDVKNEEISELRAALSKKDAEVALLSSQVGELIKALQTSGQIKTNDEKAKDAIKELQIQYKMMTKQQFEPWVTRLGVEKFNKYPIEIQTDILEKWEGLFDKDKKFPY